MPARSSRAARTNRATTSRSSRWRRPPRSEGAIDAHAPKPVHLGARYAAMFQDEDVCRAYRARPPYPAALFDLLEELTDPPCRVVLDAGAGPGDIARGLAPRFARVDAVEPSRAMIEEGRRREGGDAGNLRWIEGPAETAALDPPYGLVVAGQSLAWMEWSVVLPRWRESMTTRAWVVIVERTWDEAPWRPALGRIIAEFSTNRDYRPYDLFEELSSRGLFELRGRRVVPGEVASDVDHVIEGLHSQNGLARFALGVERTSEFDAAVRAALAPFARHGRLSVPAGAFVTWGRPA